MHRRHKRDNDPDSDPCCTLVSPPLVDAVAMLIPERLQRDIIMVHKCWSGTPGDAGETCLWHSQTEIVLDMLTMQASP